MASLKDAEVHSNKQDERRLVRELQALRKEIIALKTAISKLSIKK